MHEEICKELKRVPAASVASAENASLLSEDMVRGAADLDEISVDVHSNEEILAASVFELKKLQHDVTASTKNKDRTHQRVIQNAGQRKISQIYHRCKL